MRKTLLVFGLLVLPIALLWIPSFVQAQSRVNAIYGNAASLSNALVIDNGGLFTGMIIPDEINSDAITFTVSVDGTNFYKLNRSRLSRGPTAVDSAGVYTIIPEDTTVVYYVTFPEEVFQNIRKMKIKLDANTSASQDTIIVLWKPKAARWF